MCIDNFNELGVVAKIRILFDVLLVVWNLKWRSNKKWVNMNPSLRGVFSDRVNVFWFGSPNSLGNIISTEYIIIIVIFRTLSKINTDTAHNSFSTVDNWYVTTRCRRRVYSLTCRWYREFVLFDRNHDISSLLSDFDLSYHRATFNSQAVHAILSFFLKSGAFFIFLNLLAR